MEIDFTRVSYEGELSDFSEDQLRELIGEFEDAQESNVAEFQKAAEATTIDDSTIEDFEKARERLVEEIVGAEAFDEVPLTEDGLKDEDFSDLQDWRDFVAGEDASDETEEGDDEEGFDDFGKKAPVEGSGDEDADFVDDALGNIQGLNL